MEIVTSSPPVTGPAFVHLHCHSDYSLLDGCALVDNLAGRAAALGMPALALTDHGNLFGLVDFYKAAQKKSVKPLLGCEIYLVVDHRMTERPKRTRQPDEEEQEGAEAALANKIYHMGLLARDEEGYRNLCRLVSMAHLQGLHYRPRVDLETLRRYSGGLLGFTGCLQGVVPQHLLRGERDKARYWIDQFIQIFGREHYYVELQDHGLEAQRVLHRDLLELAREFGLKAVCTNDVHYVDRAHTVAHDLLLCIQTGKRRSDEKRLRYSSDQFFLKSGAEMAALFGERPDLLQNTLVAAESCNLKLPFGKSHYPVFRLPEEAAERCPDNPAYLRELCRRGLQTRYGVDLDAPDRAADPAQARLLAQRVDFELSIIKQTGFVDYFLIVADFIAFARSRDIPVGPGRGSGAGCLVAYLTGITDIDPIRFKLLFERFLNPERVSPPDFDIDFCMRRRDEVIEYVRAKYGQDSVANIITFGTFGPKLVVRDIARVMDVSYADADRIAKMVPEGPEVTIETALAGSAEFQAEVTRNPVAREIVEHGRVIEGMARNTGRHAAGVIIGDRPLIELVPLTLQEGAVTTQYPKSPVEALGLLKMDFLGLKTLTVIADAEANVRRTADPGFAINRVPLDDARTFQLLNEARTVGVFQLESGGMQGLCRQFRISSVDEIIALIALYRPGPMQFIPRYIEGKQNPAAIVYPHPLLEEVCRETYGILVYQEQVMEAAKVLAGYSLGGADILRRAMGKKDKDEMDRQRGVFVAGAARAHQIGEKTALEIFGILEKFAEYGFNKSHSAAYAILAYQTAYLKANYPIQFMAAVLSCELGNSDNVAKFIDECLAMGVAVRGPHANLSRENFTPLIDSTQPGAGSILFGLGAIKGVGDAAACAILAERDRSGPFPDFPDFLRRVDTKAVNRRVAENLLRTGAFDYTGQDRGDLLHDLDRLMQEAAQTQRDRALGQGSLFDLLGAGGGAEEVRRSWTAPARPGAHRLPLGELLQAEKDLLGFYVSGHPLEDYQHLARGLDSFTGEQFRQMADRAPYRLCVVVSKVDKKISKKDSRPWAVVNVSTREAGYTIHVFSESWEKTQALFLPGAVLLVTGSVSSRNGEMQLTVDTARPLAEAAPSLLTRVLWILHPDDRAEDFLHRLATELDASPGGTTVRVGFLVEPARVVTADLANSLRWHLRPAEFRALARHPAVADLRLEALPVTAREPPWKRNGKGRS